MFIISYFSFNTEICNNEFPDDSSMKFNKFLFFDIIFSIISCFNSKNEYNVIFFYNFGFIDFLLLMIICE